MYTDENTKPHLLKSLTCEPYKQRHEVQIPAQIPAQIPPAQIPPAQILSMYI